MKLVRRSSSYVLLQNPQTFELIVVSPEIYDTGNRDQIIQYSIPYSYPFDLFLDHDGEVVTRKLYSAGIHTLTDVLNNRARTKSILGDKNSVEDFINRIKGESK